MDRNNKKSKAFYICTMPNISAVWIPTANYDILAAQQEQHTHTQKPNSKQTKQIEKFMETSQENGPLAQKRHDRKSKKTRQKKKGKKKEKKKRKKRKKKKLREEVSRNYW